MSEKMIFQQLKEADGEFYRQLLDNLHDGIYFLDLERRITFWNKAAAEITGYSESEVLGLKCSDKILIHVNEYGNYLCNELCPVKKTLDDGKVRKLIAYLHHKEGHRLPASIRVIPIRNGDSITGAVEIFTDNSPRLAMPQRLQELNRMDLLDIQTGVPNRRFLEIHLNSRLEEFRRYHIPFGVLFIDIDNFMKIHEKYGRYIANKALMMVAKTLFKNTRFFDTVGRWENDQFLAVILNIDEIKLDVVTNKLRLLVAESHTLVETGSLNVTISIGATVIQGSDDIERLVSRAKKLMGHAKWLGKNRVALSFEKKGT